MSQRKLWAVILSIALAVLVPLGMALKATHVQSNLPVVKFAIEPYDPRDLLSGHYMMFGFKWNWKDGKADPKACQSGICCLCVGEGDADPEVSLVECLPADAPPTSCQHILEGNYQGGEQFSLDINRFYVDERIAMPLQEIFRDKKENFSVGLYMSPTSKPQLEKLYVGGQPVNDYVDAHGGSLETLSPDTPAPRNPTP